MKCNQKNILEMLEKLEKLNSENKPRDPAEAEFLRGYAKALQNIRFIVSVNME